VKGIVGLVDVDVEPEGLVPINDSNDVLTLDMVEVFPEFPGGEEKFYKYLKDNIVYPKEAIKKGIKGTVLVRFVVKKDGGIADVVVTRSPSKLLSDEAIRVIQFMPRWNPGKQDGKPVNVYFVLPVNFQLD
jgi:protein TonB